MSKIAFWFDVYKKKFDAIIKTKLYIIVLDQQFCHVEFNMFE